MDQYGLFSTSGFFRGGPTVVFPKIPVIRPFLAHFADFDHQSVCFLCHHENLRAMDMKEMARR